MAVRNEKNRIKKAVALRYETEYAAPKVIASGKGEFAEGIIRKAGENKVPLYKDATLAATLGMLELGEEIPAELYEVVAEILIFVSKLDGLAKKPAGGEQRQ